MLRTYDGQFQRWRPVPGGPEYVLVESNLFDHLLGIRDAMQDIVEKWESDGVIPDYEELYEALNGPVEVSLD